MQWIYLLFANTPFTIWFSYQHELWKYFHENPRRIVFKCPSASQRPCPNVHKHKKASEFNVSLTNKCKGLDYISLKICGIYVETCPHLHPVFFILDRWTIYLGTQFCAAPSLDGVACTLVRRGVTYVLWWIGIWIPLSATLTLVTPNKWCSLFVVYWLRFLLKFEPLMVSASFVFNSSWRCGQRMRIRMVVMLWSQTRAPLTKVWQLSQGC